jgi:hypothetical protein
LPFASTINGLQGVFGKTDRFAALRWTDVGRPCSLPPIARQLAGGTGRSY